MVDGLFPATTGFVSKIIWDLFVSNFYCIFTNVFLRRIQYNWAVTGVENVLIHSDTYSLNFWETKSQSRSGLKNSGIM